MKKKAVEKGQVGQSFDDFLKETGRYDESTNQAVKRVIAYELAAAMQDLHLTKTAFAKKMNTSRAQLDRLLDPSSGNVTLEMLSRAAHVVGRQLQVELR